MKYFLNLMLLSCLLCSGTAYSQVITIQTARTKAINTNVTVRGIIINGPEIGVGRYIQDGTGGLGIYAPSYPDLKRGDSIEITGDLQQFNNLLQISTNVTVTVLDSNRKVPDPIEFNIATDAFAEKYEGQLVKINNVSSFQQIVSNACGSAVTSFDGNKNYCLNNNSVSAMRVSNPSGTAGDIIGKNAPSGKVAVVGIMSQFKAGAYDTTATTGFQLLVRLYDDFVLPPKPNIISDPRVLMNQVTKKPEVYKDHVILNFKTQNSGSTRFEYGTTPALGSAIGDSLYSKDHVATLTGLQPSTVYYVRAISSNPYGVSISTTVPFITVSNSSGTIRIYFNNPVDTTVATFQKAHYLDKTMDDTMVAYIDKAKKTLDLAIYNINPSGSKDFIAALNNAHNRGVVIRVVYDGSTANVGLNNLDPSIGIISRPAGKGIMHNKFMVIDVNDSNANVPWVWTGSTNLTKAQLQTDQNNMVFVQDQSLAKVYTIEFEEMFGSSGSMPNTANSKLGGNKSDNTPHDLIINGKYIEQSFSPSDRTTSRIINACSSADKDIYIMTMSFTRSDIATAIRNRIYAGAYGACIVDDTSGAGSTIYNMFAPGNVMGSRSVIYKGAGIMHQKVAVIDPNNDLSDPQVVTGSHNWSTAAENDNDENILIIHDANITNQYYQAARGLYNRNSGINLKGFANFTYDSVGKCSYDFVDHSSLKANQWSWYIDNIKVNNVANFNSMVTQGVHSVKLVVANDSLSDSATYMLNNYNICEGVASVYADHRSLKLYPNPAGKSIQLELENAGEANGILTIYTMNGQQVRTQQVKSVKEIIELSALAPGIYLFRYTAAGGISSQLVIVQ